MGKQSGGGVPGTEEAVVYSTHIGIPSGKTFILDTDASNDGIGGVLSQEIEGQEKVIA